MRSKKYFIGGFLLVLVGLLSQCRKIQPFNEADYDERLSGGSMTIFDAGVNAFTHSFPLSSIGEFNHEVGDVAFEARFVSAPAPVNPGLGPMYNHVSCISCHVNDGRGKPSSGIEQLEGMLFRVSMPSSSNDAPVAVPNYGLQLQTRAIFGYTPECKVAINYGAVSGTYPDGTPYTLQKPTYTVQSPYTSIPAGMLISPRIASPVFGLGLLDAVSESDIVKRQDILDIDQDGISGKANYVWDIAQNKKMLGRYGWKASQPTLIQQSAAAYSGDMGITTSFFPKENCYGQLNCSTSSDHIEISDSILHGVAFYLKTLMVPARRNVGDANVVTGKKIFTEIGCDKCHTPVLYTSTNVAFKELSNQRIQPYTDLLLHDMGDDLADNRPDFMADGKEWRTPPLWGIGLTETANGHTNFLHDGRAKSIEDAILWHGGEAEKSKIQFKNLSKLDRQKLLDFIHSL